MRVGRLRVVLAAEEAAGVQTLKLLANLNHEVFMVLTTSNVNGFATASVAGLAKRIGCLVKPAALVKDPEFAQILRAEGVDLLLNVHSLHRMNKAVVDAPAIGSFNLHPGPLPSYAGLNCPSWAIYNGETQYGVSLHWMNSGIDTGDVAYTLSFPLSPADTGLTVSGRCVSEGQKLIRRLLDDAAAGVVPRVPQNLKSRRVYLSGVIPNHGKIDWSLPAQRIYALVRAADYHPLPSPWGYPLSEIGGCAIGVIKVQPTGRLCKAPPGTICHLDQDVAVATADRFLVLRLIAYEGRFVKPVNFPREGMQFEA